MTGGFALVAVGVATLAAGSVGFADDFFGGFGALFGVPAYPQYAQPAYAPRARAAHTRRVARRDAPKLTVHLASKRGDVRSVRAGGLSMCVRTCDGFAFPVGTYHGSSDRAGHEATCRNQCPGAATSLFVLPGGADTIGDAVEVKSGKAYSQIPSAFRYTTFLQESCSCHPREGNRIASLLRDYTLRRGDAIMTQTGFKVFHGGDHFPHQQRDFVALSSSRDVHDRQRATFHAIERASRRVPATVAQIPVRFPKDASKTHASTDAPAGTAKDTRPSPDKEAALALAPIKLN